MHKQQSTRVQDKLIISLTACTTAVALQNLSIRRSLHQLVVTSMTRACHPPTVAWLSTLALVKYTHVQHLRPLHLCVMFSMEIFSIQIRVTMELTNLRAMSLCTCPTTLNHLVTCALVLVGCS